MQMNTRKVLLYAICTLLGLIILQLIFETQTTPPMTVDMRIRGCSLSLYCKDDNLRYDNRNCSTVNVFYEYTVITDIGVYGPFRGVMDKEFINTTHYPGEAPWSFINSHCTASMRIIGKKFFIDPNIASTKHHNNITTIVGSGCPIWSIISDNVNQMADYYVDITDYG